MLRDARTTALVKLRRSVVNLSKGRLWAVGVDFPHLQEQVEVHNLTPKNQ